MSLHMTRSRRGFTLIEVVMAYVILAGLILMVLYTVSSAKAPVTDATRRSEMVQRGTGAMNSILFEVEGGGGQALPEVGTYDPTGSLYGMAQGNVWDVDDTNDGAVKTGRAIRFRRVYGWISSTDETDFGPRSPAWEVILAFVPDEAQDGVDNDNDGLVDEFKLIRQERAYTADGGLVAGFGSAAQCATIGDAVTILTDIVNGGANLSASSSDQPAPYPGDTDAGPVPEPYFSLNEPSNVEIYFRMGSMVDYETATHTKVLGLTEFRQNVNVRNRNQ